MSTRSISSSRFLIARTAQKSLYVPGAAQTIPFIPSATGFNIGFWFRGMPFTVAYRNIIYSLNASVDGFKLDLPNTNYGYMETQMFNASAVTVNANSGALVTPSEWNYISITYVPNSFKVYHNGVLRFTDSSCSMSVAGLANTKFGSSLLNAYFARITLHNRDTAWSTTEINNLMYRDVIPSGAKYYSLNNTNLDQDGANGITLSGTSYSSIVPPHMNVRPTVTNRFLVPTTAQKSLFFNGSTGYATIPIAPSVDGFSIGFWIYSFNTTGYNRAVSCTTTTTKGFDMIYQNNKQLGAGMYDSSQVLGVGDSQKSYLNWQHVALTFAPNNAKYYINGVQTATDSLVSMGVPDYLINIGRTPTPASYSKFYMKNLTFQNTATPWTAQQVSDLFYKNVIPNGALQWAMNDVVTDQNGQNALTIANTSYSTNVPPHMNIRALT